MSTSEIAPEQSLAPTTTTQQDITLAGQRKVNLIWEFTQAAVALMVVGANIAVWLRMSFVNATNPIPEGLSNALFLIVGFYFSRTNHAAIGGVGHKPSQPYEGR
jgi:uncharacterized oligopeptide transporter (OPT) family protein